MIGEDGISAIEYLEDKTYLINKMKENGLKLIETGTFKDMYENMKEYVNTIKEVETKLAMREYLQNKLSKYYEDNEINKECKKISFLNRIVFEKKNKKLIFLLSFFNKYLYCLFNNFLYFII